MTTKALDRATYITSACMAKATKIATFLASQPAADILGHEEFIQALEHLEQDARDALARAAGQRSPSPETWQTVISVVSAILAGRERLLKAVERVAV